MQRIVSQIFRQRPADTVTFVFLFFLIILTLFNYRIIPDAPSLLILYPALVLAQIILIRLKNRGKFAGYIYDLIFPVLCVLIVFDSLGKVVHYVNPKDIDPVLIRLDNLIFGADPAVLLEKIANPFLTDILEIAYTTYYFMAISLGVMLLLHHKREEFNRTIFFVLLCFYLSYLGYIIFPALGPRFALAELKAAPLKGFLVAEPIQNFLNWLEGIKRDAFPSGHTAIALTVLYLSYSFEKKLFRILLPAVLALIFSTVYCRYHYVVDVLAGIVLAVLTVLLGQYYYAWWSKKWSRSYAEKEDLI
jgi:membrane-associated phospholipid phosphatase